MSAPHALTLPPAAAHHWPRVQRYLIAERGLPCSALLPLRQSGILYADARANAVFLLGDTAAAGSRLSSPFGTQACGSRIGGGGSANPA